MQKMNYMPLLVVGNMLLSTWVATAVPNNGSAQINRVLLLADGNVTSDRSTSDDRTYYFTMKMPGRAGTQFAKLSLSFTEQNRDKTVAPIRFDLASTKAFMGSMDARGRAIDIKNAWIDETGILWVEFDASVQPKTQLTLALKTLPSSPVAAYGYSIAAYPNTNFSAVFVDDGTLTMHR